MLSDSKLGFGLMRLPRKADGEIDTRQVCVMVDKFLSAGFTYFDTAYVYEGSEVAANECLVKRYPRASYTIADKLPAWELKSGEDMSRVFQESLSRLSTDYIDFYLLHAVSSRSLAVFDRYDAWGFVKKLKEEGRIRHTGFSFHDSPELLDKLLSAHKEVEFVQLQINYLDWERENVWSRAILETARKYGVPVVVMEPVKGGQLALLPPREGELYKKAYPEASQASLALRFASSQEGVMTVLSGMSDIEQMEDNLHTYTSFQPLSKEDNALIDSIVGGVASYDTIPCTACRYCVEGCPKKIKIPEIFRVSNRYTMYQDKEDALKRYQKHIGESSASSCVRCGKCEKVCPQHLEIRKLLQSIAQEFGC